MKLLSIVFVVFLTFAPAMATPIRPDLKKLLDSPRPNMHFAPARAGWNGPEEGSAQRDQQKEIEGIGATSHQSVIKESLLQAVTPDWRVFLALGALIFLLRELRRRTTPALTPASYPIPVDAIEPVRHRPAA